MSPERGGPAAGDGQHYESFIVRVRLNDDGSIRDTRMEHIGTGEVRRWAGWEHNAMLGFVKEAAAPTAFPALLAAQSCTSSTRALDRQDPLLRLICMPYICKGAALH